jgi:hypothetical protein
MVTAAVSVIEIVSVAVADSVRAAVPTTALDVRLDTTRHSCSSGDLSTRYARSR